MPSADAAKKNVPSLRYHLMLGKIEKSSSCGKQAEQKRTTVLQNLLCLRPSEPGANSDVFNPLAPSEEIASDTLTGVPKRPRFGELSTFSSPVPVPVDFPCLALGILAAGREISRAVLTEKNRHYSESTRHCSRPQSARPTRKQAPGGGSVGVMY